VQDAKAKKIFGIYTVLPLGYAVVVQADLRLLGSIAGALVGWPDQVVKEHVEKTPMDEILRDAVSEVLNVAAAAMAVEGRVVFSNMVTSAAYVDGAAGEVLKSPVHRSYFSVSIEGYVGGKFVIFSPFVPKQTV
jgi:hypothetical protein